MSAGTSKRPSPRARMWSAMRQLRIFDRPQISLVTESPTRLTQRFVQQLRRTGFIVPVGKRYRLARDSGPKAPVEINSAELPRWKRRLLGLYDPNTSTAHGVDGQPAPAISGTWLKRKQLGKRRLRRPAKRGTR